MTPHQLVLEFSDAPALGQADFLTAPCNADAVAWLGSARPWPAPALVLHGPPACGKSHLARIWAERTQATLLTPDQLCEPLLPHWAGKGAALVLDRADSVAGEEHRETLLFHLYNLVAAAGGRLLLLARGPAAQWPLRLPDLRLRLLAAPAVAIGAPDDAVLAAVLVKRLGDRQLRPAPGVVDYLVPRMERSFAAADRLAAVLDRAALAVKRPLTVALARTVLAELEGEKDSDDPE